MKEKDEIKARLAEVLKQNVSRIVLSNRADSEYKYKKLDIKGVVIKGREQYQITGYTEKQAFQSNVDKTMILGQLLEVFPDKLKQMNLFTDNSEISFKVSKKGKLLKNVNKMKSGSNAMVNDTDSSGINSVADMNDTTFAANTGNTHNRVKNYILKEGTVIPPLVDMGVFTREGKVVHSMYDKFKQINRFIEMVDDVLRDYAGDEINIIDFGCGKSYLTFILYYYLVEIKKKRANITGLDLKKDVIIKCNNTAKKYGYENLHFELGDINGYKSDMHVDMVVTLHACDTATDYALYNAVKWNAKYILSVPCCQHEVNGQIKSDTLAPMMKYGIIKERMSALATDALRGNMLEYCGYKTQLLEFVDLAHSPKNILIRAVKSNISNAKRQRAYEEAQKMCEFLDIEPSIYKLLGGE